MRNYKPYTSYKLLPEEQQLPVLYKLTRQEGILFAYAVEDDTYAINFPLYKKEEDDECYKPLDSSKLDIYSIRKDDIELI